ncbi:MAG: hypothetical protein IJ120_10565 [Solobacterium sp.]|nr:hypothetical protein [Solobacterium sp.]
MNDLLTEYFESGAFERKLDEVSGMLPYVEKDPTAFYTSDEYRRGCEALKQFVILRAQSVRKQLNGELSTISAEQSDQDNVDASQLHLADTGAVFPKQNTEAGE